jgi:hypothetical protein
MTFLNDELAAAQLANSITWYSHCSDLDDALETKPRAFSAKSMESVAASVLRFQLG